jgi:hypoxanthine phosphoribosyltransferase
MNEAAREAHQVLEQAELLHSAEQVQAAMDRMAAAITAQLGDSAPLFLCVLTGAIVPAGQLLSRLEFPLELDYVHATRYRRTTRGGDIQWICQPHLALTGRTVVVVDDILDEGHTLAAIIDYCREQGAAAVYSAVLVDKRHDRRVPGLQADFVGLQVEDRYVFGQGMDYKGFLRNLPGIYAVRDQ